MAYLSYATTVQWYIVTKCTTQNEEQWIWAPIKPFSVNTAQVHVTYFIITKARLLRRVVWGWWDGWLCDAIIVLFTHCHRRGKKGGER